MPSLADIAAAIREMKESLSQLNKQKFNTLAEELINAGQFDLCLHALDEYELIAGVNNDINIFRGVIAVAKKDYNLAEKLFLEALKADEKNKNIDILYNLAWVYENTKKYEDAQKYLLKALNEAQTEAEGVFFQEALSRVKLKAMPGTNILICYRSSPDNLRLCLLAIREHTHHLAYKIFIMCYSENIAEIAPIVKSFSNVELVECGSLDSVMQAYRRAFKLCAQHYDTLFLHDDTIVTPGWLSNMKIALHNSTQVGAVSCLSNTDRYHQAVGGRYKNFEELKNFGMQFNISDTQKWEKRVKLSNWAILVKDEAFDRGKIIDGSYSYPECAFDDMCVALQKKGFFLILCKDVFIHHSGADSKGGRKWELSSKDEQYFEQKWGFNNFYSMCIRVDLIDFIRDDRDKELNVLEVGSACGATLLKIQQEFKKSKTYGIELNKHSASIASIYFPVKFCNVEQDFSGFEENYFDYIILGDILEHLYRPDKVVLNMKKYLKKHGKLLASLPNVAHFSVVHGLLSQKWEYVTSGLLDITHLRFFNFNEVEKFALSEGYSVKTVRYTEIFKSEIQKLFISNLSTLAQKDLTKNLTAYQYLVELENSNSSDVNCSIKKDKKRQNFAGNIETVSELVNSQNGVKKTLIVNIKSRDEFSLASSKINSRLYATVNPTPGYDAGFCDDKCLKCNIETEDVKRWYGQFNAIVIDEELETSINPWQFLNNLKKYLAQGGFIVVGVKNTAHIRVISRLLLHDRWQFSLYGDESESTRFFTGKSIEDSFAVCRYKVLGKKSVEIAVTSEEQEFYSKIYENKQNLSISEDEAKELLTYKYYYVVEKI